MDHDDNIFDDDDALDYVMAKEVKMKSRSRLTMSYYLQSNWKGKHGQCYTDDSNHQPPQENVFVTKESFLDSIGKTDCLKLFYAVLDSSLSRKDDHDF